jgi:hypothetical protein
MPIDQDMTFLRYAAYGATWTGITWPGEKRATWLWLPTHPLLLIAGLDTADRLIDGGWEHIGVWPDENALTAIRLWSQLSDVLLVVQSENAEVGDLWARTADIAHAKAAPVMLAFHIPDQLAAAAAKHDMTFRLATDIVLPPAQLGEIGTVVIDHDGKTVLAHYEANALGGEVQAAQQRLGERLRQLERTYTSVHAPAGYLPDEWLTQWEEAQQMAQELTEAYWRRAKRDRVGDIPDAFAPTGRARVLSAMPAQTVLNAYSAAARDAARGPSNPEPDKNWGHDIEGVPTFRQVTSDHDTVIQMRPTDGAQVLDDDLLAALWRQVRSLGDLDGDVFLAMLAQVMLKPDDPDGVWITVDRILDYRGVAPMMKRDTPGGEPRRAGHRFEDRLAIAESIARQTQVWVIIRSMIAEEATSRKRKPGKRLYTHESRLLNIFEVVRQRELLDDPGDTHLPNLPIAWRYRIGTWANPFLGGINQQKRQVAWLCQQALAFDPYHERFEKRLARYFILQLRINATHTAGSITRTIGTLLDDLPLDVDTRHPERTRQRFEGAMNHLVKASVIDSWKYSEGKPTLPARGWFASWRECRITVSGAPASDETAIPPSLGPVEKPPTRKSKQP